MDYLKVKWPIRQMSAANEYMFNYNFETGTLILLLYSYCVLVIDCNTELFRFIDFSNMLKAGKCDGPYGLLYKQMTKRTNEV